MGLIGLPAEKPAHRTLSGSTVNLLKSISETLDQMLAQDISKRTAEEFSATASDVFPQYVSFVVAFARVVSKKLDRGSDARVNPRHGSP